MASKAVKVRSNSRAGCVMRALLETGEVDHQPGYEHLLLPGGVAARVEDVVVWAKRKGLEFRDHDIVELSRYLGIIGYRDHAGDAFRLPSLPVARGRWSEANDWNQEFDDDPSGWTELM